MHVHRDSVSEQVKQKLMDWKPSDKRTPAADLRASVTIMATTFERPRCVLNFIQSVRRFYPELKVLICDNSRTPLFPDGTALPPDIAWLNLPDGFEPTVGAGRNHLLDRVKTPYFFLADDDHMINEHTDLHAMYRFLERRQYDIVGGCQGRGDYGTAVFEKKNDVAYQYFYRHHGLIEPGVVRCDRVSNTFMARTETVRRIRWEHRVYANEHAEFFLRASGQALRIAQMSGVYVDHRRDCESVTGMIGRLFGRFMPHRDWRYRRMMMDLGRFGGRSARARLKERKYCFEKNGVRAVKSVSRRKDARALKALLENE